MSRRNQKKVATGVEPKHECREQWGDRRMQTHRRNLSDNFMPDLIAAAVCPDVNPIGGAIWVTVKCGGVTKKKPIE